MSAEEVGEGCGGRWGLVEANLDTSTVLHRPPRPALQYPPEIPRHVERDHHRVRSGAVAGVPPEHAQPFEADAERGTGSGGRDPWCARHGMRGPPAGDIRRD